ncbi:Family S53 protease-like protein [Mycena venus]|uniref:Family S53 protease-like protein n=1 Tax=Mycena venus TaxID=2733690 RepID=A0A8H6X6V3_9AGAR|nr:Family S53 protease-like protein [Mycena venus]
MAFNKLANFLTLISAVSGGLVLHQSRSAAPARFISLGEAPATDLLTLRFGLTPNNVNGLHEKLVAISTPGSPDFRQWLSKDEVKSFVQPSNETVAVFNSFAAANGLKPSVISPNGDWVSLTLPVSQANELFGAQFEKFTHPSLAAPITRALSISLPSELVHHVDAVHPPTSFAIHSPGLPQVTFPSRNLAKRAEPVSSCNSSRPDSIVTPTCLQKIYGIPSTPATQKDNKILVTGYTGTSPNRTDLTTFLKQFRPDIFPNTTFDIITLGNVTNPDPEDIIALSARFPSLKPHLAAKLELIGLATGVPVEFLSVGLEGDSFDFATAFLDTNTFLDGLDNPPSVVTTSYVPQENQFESSIAKKICDSYMALGARGISVLFASGDGGVRGSHDTTSIPGFCESNVFIPIFPASCPYVTAVGGTQGFNPEVAVNLTGGGFSDLFPRPWYQTQAVDSFLKTIPSDFPLTFDKSGRGYPDVAVQGSGLDVVRESIHVVTEGTSFSAPIFASIIALINDRLMAAGKKPLGFLNPWLYANEKAFTDITEGHNSGLLCPASSVAFDATKGWDALISIPQGSSSIPLATKLAMEKDVMLLIPRRTSFGTAAPLISDVNWLSIPVNDSSKCESFLAIGKYILEACVSDIVYQQEYNLPLTDELVLNSLTSNRTLQSVLMRTGVFSEPNIVPVHFPAKAFKVYLGVLFLVEALPFACIFTWLNEIFMPIAHSLRHKPGGMGDYRENRAVLAAAGYELGSNK